MTTRFARTNGINVAYRVEGAGPPLVLVMGYRLHSAAWPATFTAQLARRFTVVTLDNRGTGRSDKPVEGYALANMARDIRGLLDELGLAQVHLLGYSMGGAIAQEFVRQFPDRVQGLILCATMAGGPQAAYADSAVVGVMRDLDGLSPEQAARRIWDVTYAPDYLEKHRAAAEHQMLREIALPTPLHAADLQFQAFAEFDGSRGLSAIRSPTLILTGDLDRLISPQNSRDMARRIPGARLVVIPSGGHRVLWEATDACVSHILDFLGATGRHDDAPLPGRPGGDAQGLLDPLISTAAWLGRWPEALAGATADSLVLARQSMMAAGLSRFGDGKPVVLVPPQFGSDLALLPLSLWLKALGYRPVTAGLLLNTGGHSSTRRLVRAIDDVTARVGRKAVLLAHSTGLRLARQAAEDRKDRVSDVIVLDALPGAKRPNGVRVHFVSSGWPPLAGVAELPALLRSIGIALIDVRPGHVPATTSRR